MPAAPAGRALPHARGRADSPCRNRHPARLHAGLRRPARQPLGSRARPSPPRRRRRARGVDAAAYWAFADRLQDHLDAHWGGEAYYPGRSMYNANMLLTHAAAALAGHTGPARQDERARKLITALCEGKAWRSVPADGPQGHVPGWTDSLGGHPMQHLVVDTEIAWALAVAWRARDALGLDPATSDLIADRIISHDRGRVLALARAAAEPDQLVRADVPGGGVGRRRPGDLHGQLLQQLRRFVDGATRR